MEYALDIWSLGAVLAASFAIGWAAETAQVFISRTLALILLAWLQTAPEFAIEATIAWDQTRDLMVANLTGSLRLLVGLGWPLIFFVYFFCQGVRHKRFVRSIRLEAEDSLGVVTLFASVLYFIFIWAKGSLAVPDSVVLILIYGVYLVLGSRLPARDGEEKEDLPWIGKRILKLPPLGQKVGLLALFGIGGFALYVSIHPFLDTLQRWSIAFGISTFVFVQWVAPFVSEFPEKLSAVNWARQPRKAPMAVMNMVNSNVNQWTMLAASIPIVFSFSIGHATPIVFDPLHERELALTVAQSLLGVLLLLDLELGLFESILLFVLWLVQFVNASLREPVTYFYVAWCLAETGKLLWSYKSRGHVPRALMSLRQNYGKELSR